MPFKRKAMAIEAATADTATDMATPITGQPKAPGVAQTTCDMNTANCTF